MQMRTRTTARSCDTTVETFRFYSNDMQVALTTSVTLFNYDGRMPSQRSLRLAFDVLRPLTLFEYRILVRSRNNEFVRLLQREESWLGRNGQLQFL